jgi:acetyl esterase/lipase
MISLRAKIVRFITGAYFSRLEVQKIDVQSLNQRWHKLSRFLWTAREVKVERVEMHGLKAEWLLPERAPADKVLLYLHGGAYVMGGCATHRQFVSYLAREAGVRALLPEYRLAPRHRFPAAVDDALGLYRALLADGYDAEDIVVAGDSAGGGLTMAMLLSLRDAGDPLPAAACLLSPWLDLVGTGETMNTNAHRDPWFRPEDMRFVSSYYCEDDQLRDPLVSPVYGDLSGLPPIFLQVGADEILLSDSTRAAEMIKAAGGEVAIEIWPEMWHVFPMFVCQMPESRAAIAKLGAYMRKALAMK